MCSTDYDNAKGGYLGDTTINFRYLLQNLEKDQVQDFLLVEGLLSLQIMS